MSDARDSTIDVLRGVAVVTMTAANLAGPVLVEPHPLWLRFYGSFAAPVFVLLAGMMVGLTAGAHHRGPAHFLARGACIVAVGALVDVLTWGIVPFTTVDVLYLIGLGLPVCALALQAAPPVRWTIALVIFLATPVLQSTLGYTEYPTELYLSGAPTLVTGNRTPIVNHWLVDGFFPFFPWAGFAVLGACLALRRWRDHVTVKRVSPGWGAASVLLLFIGCAIWRRWPGALLTRGGYSEMFYPPTPGYVLTAFGLIGALFWLVDRGSPRPGSRALGVLGESALAMYVLHLLVIRYVIKTFWPARIELPGFLVLYVLLTGVLLAAAHGLHALKRRWRPRGLPLAVVMGG